MKTIEDMLAAMGDSFDIILDPEIGPMELQEIGIEDRLDYDRRDRFAFAREMDNKTLRQLISDITENLGIREDEPEITDKITEKVVKTIVEFDSIGKYEGLWVTFWYDSRVGSLHRQSRMEMYIKPHERLMPERFDYYDIKKGIWINKLAIDFRKIYNNEEIEMDQLNDYIKENNLLWMLEEIVGERYDVWDFLDDINTRINEKH